MSSELIDLEEQGWRALATSGEAAAQFYRQVLDDNPVIVLPGGLMFDDREVIIQSMSGQPWSAYELFGVRASSPPRIPESSSTVLPRAAATALHIQHS